MNIDRREFQNLYANHRDDVESVHVYSDGSPVVGEEVQGMALYIFILGVTHRYVLPDVVLHFGGTRLVDKAVAFLWALHLVIGTDYPLMTWFLGLVVSITTDMGTEIRLVDVPDISRACLRTRMGVPCLH